MFVCSRLWKLVLTGTLLNSSSTLNPTSSKHFLAIVDFGVVAAGGEIVEAGFGIVVITAIMERVGCAKRSCQGAGGGYQLAPRIVDIFSHTHAAFVHKANYIILAVSQIIVLRAVVVYGYRLTVGIVDEQQRFFRRCTQSTYKAIS